MRAHDPHIARSTRVMEKRSGWSSYHGKNLPQLPTHNSGPGPTTCCAYVWPRPGGSCRCTKVGALLLTPLLVHGQSEPPATATHRHGRKGKPGRSRSHKDKRSNNKDQGHEDQMGEAGFPSRTLARVARPRQPSEPPLSPPTLDECVGTRLGRHLCGGMQIFVKT